MITRVTELSWRRIIDELKRLNAEGVKGAIVECGVYRGDFTKEIFKYHLNDPNAIPRDYWAFDTFEGMPDGVAGVDYKIRSGPSAKPLWSLKKGDHWLECSLEKFLKITGDYLEINYTPDAISKGFSKRTAIKGLVEETLGVPENIPKEIALLILDTDYYSSVLKGLDVLWPKVVPKGILKVDDYGVWHGAQRAVLDYFKGRPPDVDDLERRIILG